MAQPRSRGGKERSILLVAVDDDPASLELIAGTLEQDGLEIVSESDSAQALEVISRQHPEIVISDLMMPGMTGMDLWSEVVRIDPSIECNACAVVETSSAMEADRERACDA